MVLAATVSHGTEQRALTIEKVSGPDMRMMPRAPPVAVLRAQMVSVELINDQCTMNNEQLDTVEDFLDERVDGILIGRVHLLSITIGDDHAARHGAMSEQGSQAGKS